MPQYDPNTAKVFCQGRHDTVVRANAEFVFWGTMSCHFCKDCLELISKAKAEGREATPEELAQACEARAGSL